MAKILYINWHTRTFDPRLGEDKTVENTAPPPVRQESARRQKEPVVISVMPEQSFPIGHRDLRPLLQRDGLILLSWALWEDWHGDESLLRRYIVTWVTSRGKIRHYATRPVGENELAEAVPQRRADTYFYRGIHGNYYDMSYYNNKDIADYLYFAAPFDLCTETTPGFIKVLKALGSTVNFDVEYTLAGERAKKNKAREYLEKFASTDQAESL
jgi:hypothetical protein